MRGPGTKLQQTERWQGQRRQLGLARLGYGQGPGTARLGWREGVKARELGLGRAPRKQGRRGPHNFCQSLPAPTKRPLVPAAQRTGVRDPEFSRGPPRRPPMNNVRGQLGVWGKGLVGGSRAGPASASRSNCDVAECRNSLDYQHKRMSAHH